MRTRRGGVATTGFGAAAPLPRDAGGALLERAE
jgi:hypothetical protein